MSRTFGDICKEFDSKIELKDVAVEDYRPCIPLYEVPLIENAIVIWLKDGTKLIYISQDK